MKHLPKVPIFLAALLINLALYLAVPFMQAVMRQNALSQQKKPQEVERQLEFEPPVEKVEKQEIKEIKLAAVRTPNLTQGRPSSPGGGLKLDLSPAGGEGEELVSGGDRSGPLGAGAGGGTGSGMGAMVYEPGQTDEDARIVGPDQAPNYPPRAEREGVTGYVDVLFVVNESGFAEQISVLKEDPEGYGFASAAIEAVQTAFRTRHDSENPREAEGQTQDQFRAMKTFFSLSLFSLLISAVWAQDTVQALKDPLTLGNELYDKGEYSEAAAQYFKATKSNAGGLQRSFAWFNLGNCQVQAHAYNRAVVAYRRSVEEAPNFSRGYQILGDVYYTLGAIPEAVVAYRRVLELEGTSVHAYQMLGECALKVGDVTEALRNLDAAVKLEPDLPDLYLAEAEAYADVRDYGDAEKVLQEALLTMSKPTAEAYFYLGQLYELDENPQKAIHAYEDGLLLAPKRADYYMRIAAIDQKVGDDFLALLVLEQGIRAGIQKPDFYLLRGTIFFKQQRYDHALEEFRKAYALGSPQGRTGMENVAATYYNNGQKVLGDSVTAVVAELVK